MCGGRKPFYMYLIYANEIKRINICVRDAVAVFTQVVPQYRICTAEGISRNK